ncbi:MAG TPA: metallophosphoesterase [Chitinophagaceae bacterium]|nr:metallophosphoesterase [Chitinophagaceae bacterium]
MRKIFLGFLLFVALSINAQLKHTPFCFAFISDMHISLPNGFAAEDLRRTVQDINAMNNIAFVVITGDITELGKNAEFQLAKKF